MPRPLRSFDRMIIPAPCDADWDAMIGNERVRFCEHCHLHVTNISALTRQEAMRLVSRSEGRLCVRFMKSANGSVVTKQLPQALHHISRRVSRIAAGAFTATLSLSSAAAQTRSSGDANLRARPVAAAPVESNSATECIVGGTVTDPNGAVISGASISLQNNRSGEVFVFGTSEDGAFVFAKLAPGEYTLNAEAPTFAKAQTIELALSTPSKTTLDIRLKVPEVLEEVQISSEQSEITQLAGAVVIVRPQDPFIRAVFENDLNAVVELLHTITDINASDKATDTTALAYAVENNNLDMVHVLISAGAMANGTNAKGETPLMHLSSDSSGEFVRQLIAIGADVKADDNEGRTPLMHAASHCPFALVKELIDAGASIDARDHDGNTVLMAAAGNADADIIKLLIKRGVPLDYKNDEGESAVTLALKVGGGENLQTLIAAGASLSLTQQELNGALLVGARNGDLTTVKFALERGADVNTKDDDTTALMLATENGKPDMVKALIDAGADLDAVDNQGWTAMMQANEAENVRVLLNAGANAAIKNKAGETALELAARYDQTEIVQLLKSRVAPR
jgi:ankyrin repeat protein